MRRGKRRPLAAAAPRRRRALPGQKAPRSRVRWGWWLLAWASLGVGLAGAVLPVLPTVPFILLAVYAAARGSPRLHRRLLADPRFGPVIREWQAHGAVSRRAKWLASASMAVSALLLVWLAPRASPFGVAFMALVALWLWRRPEPPG
ncbi:MAG: YbaN family protein [Xanthomonadales bacterium]|nr:YbaN family protein [Xanthomonadales bacterium]